MKRLLMAGAFAFAVTGHALAADLPQPAPPPPQAPAAYVPTWRSSTTGAGFISAATAATDFGSSKQTSVAGTTTGTFNVTGFLAGGTIGANFQTDAFVFGVEGDFDGSWLQGTRGPAVCGLVQCETKNSWLGTLRVRAGYAADRVLSRHCRRRVRQYRTGLQRFGQQQLCQLDEGRLDGRRRR